MNRNNYVHYKNSYCIIMIYLLSEFYPKDGFN